MNAGGVIARNQIGLPDDMARDLISLTKVTNYTNPISGQWTSSSCSVPEVATFPAGWLHKDSASYQELQDRYECAENYHLGNNSDESCNFSTSGGVAQGGSDFAPDMFSLSLVNISGSFFFSTPNQVNFIDKENFKVTYEMYDNEDLGISKFIIYDDKGNKYFFEDIQYQKYQRDYWNTGSHLGDLSTSLFEPIQNSIGLIGASSFWGAFASALCSSNYFDDGVDAYMERLWPNAWHITKIITNKDKEILFEYEREYYFSLGISNSHHNFVGTYPSNSNWIFAFSHSNRLQEVDSPRLKRIIWDQGEISFIEEQTKRQDVYINSEQGNDHNTKGLDKIIIKNNYNQIIKEVRLTHSYNLSEGYSESFPDYKKSIYKRLWLDTVEFFDRSGAKVDGYNFTYNNTPLPNKFSFEQDYWGYYNNNNASSFVPNLWFYPDEENDYIDKGRVSLFPRNSFNGLEQRTNDFLTPLNSTHNTDFADRRPNDNFSKAGMLEKVNYFLGGSVEYEYEGNEFLYRGQSKKGPGVRIKRTLLKENDSDLDPISIDYVYDKNGETSGKLSALPIFTGLRHQVSSMPYNSLDLSLNGRIGYTRVEKNYHNNNTGKEVLEFSFPIEIGDIHYNLPSGENLYTSNVLTTSDLSFGPATPDFNPYYPYGYETSFSMSKGKLISHTSEDNLGNVVKEVNNSYEFHDNYNITRATFASGGNNPSGTVFIRYLSADYNLVRQNKITDDIVTNKIFEYNNQHLVNKQTIINSKSETLETVYKYPFDYNYNKQYAFDCSSYRVSCLADVYQRCGNDQDCLAAWLPTCECEDEKDYLLTGFSTTLKFMFDSNILLPIEIKTTLEQNVLSSSLNEYKKINGNLVLSKILNLKTSNDSFTDSFLRENGSYLSFENDVNYEDAVIFHDYDTKGNPLEVSKADGTHIVYLWGYHQSQPIAKIENATYSDVQSRQVANLQTLSNADNDRTVDIINSDGTLTKVGKEGDLREALRNLRASTSTSIPDSQVTTYTYDPLIGVTSITDPRGNTVYYEYDAFNRLKHVKDQDGNILSENEYRYKNH